MNATYFENARKAQARAKELGLILVPGIYNVGYSGRYLRQRRQPGGGDTGEGSAVYGDGRQTRP